VLRQLLEEFQVSIQGAEEGEIEEAPPAAAAETAAGKQKQLQQQPKTAPEGGCSPSTRKHRFAYLYAPKHSVLAYCESALVVCISQ
jgi:hypothetical protein